MQNFKSETQVKDFKMNKHECYNNPDKSNTKFFSQNGT